MYNTAILRNIQNNNLYRHIEGDIYKNIATGVQAEIPPDKAKEFLKLNVDASMILNKYPMVELLINKLKLKIEI